MTDLAGRMRALRDKQGLQLADALLRQTAKDPSATLTTLDRRFRMSGLPQTPEVLRQLISLRDAAAQQAGSEIEPTEEPVSSPTPASAAAPQVEVESWSGPPDWYSRARESPDTGPLPQLRPAAEPAAPPMAQPAVAEAESPVQRPQVLSGPPSWYTEPEVDAPPHPAQSRPWQTAGQQTQAPSAEPVAVVPVQPPPSAADLTDVALLSGLCDVFDNRDTRIRLRVDNGRLILHWTTPADVAAHTTIVYLVSASPSGVPETPDDGQRVAATLENQLIVPVDPAHFFFSVFAYPVVDVGELATATSFRHAIGRLLPEVDDLHVRAEEHGVLLSWIRPVGAERVRVMRSQPNEYLPPGPDPSRQVSFSGDSFRDRDAEPGMTYHYRIYTESQALGGGDGSVDHSLGIERRVTVPGRPTPVDRLDARVVPRLQRPGIEVSWTPPARGKVHIYLRGGELDPDIVIGVPQSREQFDVQAPLLGDRVREPIVTVGEVDSMEWVPLDTEADEGRQARWTLTAVTEFAGALIIGAHQVVVYVGDVEEVAIEERVDWQLLRSTWPSGATFLGIWTLLPGESASGGPHQMVTRDQFDASGGVGLKLPPEAQDIVVQGATKYGPKWVNGGAARVTYPGRWVLRYQLQATGRMGGSRVLHLGVERADWSDLSVLLTASEHGFPLTSQAPGVAPVYQGQLSGKSLAPNTFVPVSPEFKVPRELTTRLFAWSSGGIVPIVVDPLDPPSSPPQLLPPPPLRCPRCLIPSDLTVQYFRCEGVCPDEPDNELTELFEPGVANPAKVRSGKLVFQVPRPVISERNIQHLGPPTNAAACPRTNCQRVSRQQVCGHCHSPLPPNWWAHEVLGVVMVGARSTGKTTYLSVLIRHLERTLLPSTGGHLHPVDAASELKLAAMREGLRLGKLEPGTLSARQNDALLEPMLANIGTASDGRIRSIALFDVAGEDMSTAEGVRPYSPALASADLVLILIDPLQLDGIREWLDGTVPLPLQGAPSVTVVNNVVEQVRRQRGIPAGPLPIRAAVAFAKFDGLQEAAKIRQSSIGSLIGPGNALWRDPYLYSGEVYSDPDGRRVHDEVRALLLKVGESALVASVEASFRDVQYFAVSALGHGPRGRQVSAAGASPQRVGDPIRWLLWANGWTGR